MRMRNNEKYALIGIGVNIDEGIQTIEFDETRSIVIDANITMPDHWIRWLGTIKSRHLSGCNFFLLNKKLSENPDDIDDENVFLQKSVQNFFVGLLLASPFAPSHKPIMLSGSQRNGEMGIRQEQEFDAPVPCLFRRYPPIMRDEMLLAARLGEILDDLPRNGLPNGYWKICRVLDIYTNARTKGDVLDRLHQYSRCIEGLIGATPGNTKKQFKSRTELFIGPRHHDLMGEIYDIRGAVEHLHEYRYLEEFDRDVRLDIVKKEAIVEGISRSILARIIGNEQLLQHFANTPSLDDFWRLSSDDQRAVWGEPIDPLEAIAEFDPDRIHNGQLGAQ